MHRFRPILLAALVPVFVAACAAPAATASLPDGEGRAAAIRLPTRPIPSPVATDAVSIKNFAFGPAGVTVPAGTTVTWTNDDIEQHTVSARDKSFNSDAINNDRTFAVTFDRAGTFEYFCMIHPQMVGRVVVTDQ